MIGGAQPAKLGLIGAGRWGRNFIETISRIPEAKLAWLASRRGDARELVGPECHITKEWREISSAQVDGVVIATPPLQHAEMTRAAVAAGISVVVEKPLTLDVAEAHSLRDYVAQNDGRVLVDHTYLFHPAYRRLRRSRVTP